MKWNNEEIEFLKENYANFPTEELIKMKLHNRTLKQINDKAWRLGLKKSEEAQKVINKIKTEKFKNSKLGKKTSEETKKKISEARKQSFIEGKWESCLKGRVVTEEEKEKSRERVKGKWSGENNPRAKKPLFGKDNPNWKGGLTNLSQALRENIYEWKKNSMILCDYSCIITGGEFDQIHHLYSFNKIIKETLCELNLEVKQNLNDYIEEQQTMIKSAIQNKHILLGVCLNKEIHKLFHDNYSYNNATLKDFLDFIYKYFNGNYDDLLEDKLKSINSKRTLEEVLKVINNL